MILTGPIRYSLSFDAKCFKVRCPQNTNKFSGQAASKLPKLYIFSVDDKPIYVGITKQSLRNRLRFGWNAVGKGGYYGYEFRHHHKEAKLDIWCQEAASDGNCKDIETIEAEVVFLIRQAGQWPEFQTEIHFHPSSDEHRSWARKIIDNYNF